MTVINRLIIALLVLSLLMVSACGSPADPTPAPTGGASSSPGGASAPSEASPSSEASGEITLWFALESTDPESVAQFEALYAEPFRKQHPAVTLNFVPMPDEGFTAKIQTALAAGRAPDFIETPGSSNAIPFAEAGYLLDLGPLAEREGWAEKILPWAYAMGIIDGKLQALPTGYESLVLYYNKTLFDEHGWKPPTDRASLEALANEMQSLGIVPFANGSADFPGVGEWIISAFMNEVAGPGKVHDALTGKIRWTDPAFVETMQTVADYFKRGYFAGGDEQYFSATFPQLFAQLANGKAGMYISGSWDMGPLSEYFGVNGNTAEWAWAPLPPLASGVPSDVYPLSVGNTMSINAASKNVPAAQEYLAWMMSDTAAMWNAVVSFGANPLPINFEDADVPTEVDRRYVAQYQAINDASASGNVGYVTWTSWGGRAENYILEHMDKVFTGELSPTDFTAGMDAAFQEDLAAGVIPPVFETTAR